MMHDPIVRELVEKHSCDDMALVVLIPASALTDPTATARVFSPYGRMPKAIAANLLHALAWGLEGAS